MTKIDLVTGFLGSGKTTMIIEYVTYLTGIGERVAVICNDYGAINVDRLFLVDALSQDVPVEMVIGGDKDCARRRLKTKLISIGMGLPDEEGRPGRKFDRVIIEPSGIFDAEDFFNLIYEEPLSNWFTMGNVITMVDGSFPTDCSRAVRYMLATELSHAGIILANRIESEQGLAKLGSFLNACLTEFGGETIRVPFLPVSKQEDKSLYEKVSSAGYRSMDLSRISDDELSHFQSLFFFHPKLSVEDAEDRIEKLMKDSACGRIYRLKGFIPRHDGTYLMINATPKSFRADLTPIGQEVFILIGEDLSEDNIRSYIPIADN